MLVPTMTGASVHDPHLLCPNQLRTQPIMSTSHDEALDNNVWVVLATVGIKTNYLYLKYSMVCKA